MNKLANSCTAWRGDARKSILVSFRLFHLYVVVSLSHQMGRNKKKQLYLPHGKSVPEKDADAKLKANSGVQVSCRVLPIYWYVLIVTLTGSSSLL